MTEKQAWAVEQYRQGVLIKDITRKIDPDVLYRLIDEQGVPRRGYGQRRGRVR